MERRTISVGTVAGLAAVASTVALTAPQAATASGGEDHHSHGHRSVVYTDLVPLNSSGVTGKAKVVVKGKYVHIRYVARGLAPGLPHAAHLHFSPDARNMCPTIQDDANDDFRVDTPEGLPAYGTIRVSLTTTGDTSPDSALAVDRFPTAKHGTIWYSRVVKASRELGWALKTGRVAIVVHGIDYNANGTYDFDSAGASPLDPKLPAEATNPAACGVLR